MASKAAHAICAVYTLVSAGGLGASTVDISLLALLGTRSGDMDIAILMSTSELRSGLSLEGLGLVYTDVSLHKSDNPDWQAS